MLWDLLFIFIIVLLGAFVQGASGFGIGLVAMGFLPMMLTLKESTLLVISLIALGALNIMLRTRKYIVFKGLLLILAAAFVGRILSFFVLTTYGDLDFLKQVLGFILIGMVLYLWSSKKQDPSGKKLKPIYPLGLGFTGGFIGGTFAVGGPFFVFYFLMLYHDEKYKYNANMQVVVLATSLFSLLMHGANGDFYPSFFLYILVGFAAVFIGISLGIRWFDKLPNTLVRKFAMILVSIAALNLIIFG